MRPLISAAPNRDASLILRTALPADAPAAAEVYLSSRRHCLPYAPLAHTDGDVHAWMASVVVPRGETVLALDEAGTVLGLCTRRTEASRGWIDQLYLRPDRVAQGIGTTLLRDALERLPRVVRLYTFQANRGARRFYERHGFRVVGFGDGSGNEEGVPDLLYERSAH